jgi:hypothetical protein
MTDRHHDAYHDAPDAGVGGPLHGLINGLGAILSIGLVAGMGFWGYQLAVRDVSGVPVVRALEGPARVAPDDPGGMQAAYQGLAVNAVAAEGAAAPLPDRIVLAPPPLELDFGSGPESADRAEAAGEAAPDPAPLTQAALRADAPAPEAVPETTPGSAATEMPRVPADLPGVARSPVPPPRPGGDLVAEAAAMAALSALTPGRGIDVDPDSLAAGTRLVQLGAFDDADAARAEWNRLTGRHPALLEGHGRVIQAAESGGRTFYRLRAAGFADEAEARRFCAVLQPEQSICIPVLLR